MIFRHRNDKGENDDLAHFHHVIAYDDELRAYVENNLTKTDRVFITGRIGHMTNTSEDGKKVYSGFIVADNVTKVVKTGRSQTKSEESSESKGEN